MSSQPSAEAGGAPPGAVDIATLSAPQLRALQSRLSSELEHLTSSHAKLRNAQLKFRDCIRSINDGLVAGDDKKSNEILVPLTTSLYVKGTLSDRKNVIVDVGTGFYVEKTTTKAIAFYNAKVDELNANLRELEKVVQAKSTNLRVVEDVLHQKILSGEAGAAAGPSRAGGGGDA
ncbi:subunit of tubulin prefoldin [Emmonsiellopsis sp. PD_33]|nr:subunit of tubulin prefoldin [Emmonsiellopsis sp. PD_33]KAK2800986.1 subunit of tubulin prefoldin [Onygenales sp. PD_10]